MDIDATKIATSPEVAGLAGSLVALKFAPGTHWVERFTNVTSGFFFAIYLAPIAAEFLLNPVTFAKLAGIAFVLGLFGMSIMAALMQAFRDIKFGEIITNWLEKK